MSLNNFYNTLLSPVISEKSNRVGEQSNQYVFKVAVSSNKTDVKTAVEKLFEVKVEDVKILKVKGKLNPLEVSLEKDQTGKRLM